MLSSICRSIGAVSFPVRPAKLAGLPVQPCSGGETGTGPPQQQKKIEPYTYDTHIQADTQMENGLAVHWYTNTTPAALLMFSDLFSISHSCSDLLLNRGGGMQLIDHVTEIKPGP